VHVPEQDVQLQRSDVHRPRPNQLCRPAHRELGIRTIRQKSERAAALNSRNPPAAVLGRPHPDARRPPA